MSNRKKAVVPQMEFYDFPKNVEKTLTKVKAVSIPLSGGKSIETYECEIDGKMCNLPTHFTLLKKVEMAVSDKAKAIYVTRGGSKKLDEGKKVFEYEVEYE